MFVAFEGIDGSGKTTISNLVAQKLRDEGLSIEHLREGGKFSSPVTQAIREFGRDSRNLDLTPHAEFFLYVLRDVQLLDEKTRPALERAQVVIADRFLYSAQVLSHYGRGLPVEWMKPVLDAAARGLEPDLVVVIDVDPHIARARRRVAKIVTVDRRPPSRKGLGGVGMQQRFRAGYREMAAKNPERWIVIDNDRDLHETVERVFDIIHAAATKGVAAAVALARHEAPLPRPIGVPIATPGEALTRFLQIVDRRAETEPQVAAYLLAGLHGSGIDERRLSLLERAPETILAGTIGLTDAASWQLRERLKSKHPARVARSLAGPARLAPEASALRAELARTSPVDVLVAMETVDSDEAWALRARVYGEAPEVAAASLARITGTRADELRERYLADHGGEAGLATFEVARTICKAVTGLGDERAWTLRKAAREAAPVAAIASMKFLLDERSWKWRVRYLERAPKTVFETLARVDDPRAWQMRAQLAPLCKEAIDSLNELDGEAAWQLRDEFADVWPSTVVKTLGRLAGTPRGGALVERQLRKHPDNLSLLKHAAAIAVGAHIDPDVIGE